MTMNFIGVAFYAVFEVRNNPVRPSAVAATPPTNIHIDLSVADPLKNREMSELVESRAPIPSTRRGMPPAGMGKEMVLIMDHPS
jgi:hypothetical protein